MNDIFSRRFPQALTGCFFSLLLMMGTLNSWGIDSTTSAPKEGAGVLQRNPLKGQAHLEWTSLPQGANSPLTIQLELAPQFHAYEERFQLKFRESVGLQLSQFEISPIIEFADTFSKKKQRGIQDHAQLKTVLGVPENFPLGKTRTNLELTYQACTVTYCLLPKKLLIPLEFEVTPGNESARSNQAMSDQSLISQAAQHGWLMVFLTVFLAGILTSFTPCVFPMIPITLAVIGSKGPSKNRWRSFATTLVYVFGIAISYSFLGVTAALTGSVFGSFLGHPIVAVGFSLLFFVMALSAFGFFEIQAPQWVRRRLGTYQSKNRWIGALLSGLLAGVVAGPCVGPVLVSVLAFVAKNQDPLMGFLLLFTFALGMGQLFLVLGLSTELIHKIPKAGPWMNITQFFFGSTLIALALFYLKPVTPSPLFDLLVGLALLFVASTDGKLSFQQNSTLNMLVKSVKAIGFIAGLVFLVKASDPTLFKKYLEPPTTESKESQGQWQAYSEDLLKKAMANGQPVIIDFYADWCAACKELETITFKDPQVIKRGQGFLLMRFDATQSSPEFERLQKQFDILGLPTIVFHDGKKWRSDLTLTGFEEPSSFLKRMEL